MKGEDAMKWSGLLGVALAAGLGLAGCSDTDSRMSPDQRRAITDDMLKSEGATSGTIGVAPGSVGAP